MKKVATITFLMISLVQLSPTFAQDPPPAFGPRMTPEESSKWQTFGNADDEFHVRLPETPSVFLTRRNLKDLSGPETARIYTAYEEGLVCIVGVYDKPTEAQALDDFVKEFRSRFFSSWEMKFENNITVNTDNGEHYSLKKRDMTGAVRFFVKRKHAYMAAAVGARSDNPGVRRFLESFVMWAYPIDKMRGTPRSTSDPNPPMTLSPRNQTDSEVNPPDTTSNEHDYVLPGIKAIATPKLDTGDLPVSAPENRPAEGHPVPYYDRTFQPDEVTRRALIVLKPDPIYTEEAQNNHIEGVVKLSAVLTREGKVSDVSVIQGLPYGLTENAIKAFRHFKFLPALKDERYVSQAITVEYTFSLN